MMNVVRDNPGVTELSVTDERHVLDVNQSYRLAIGDVIQTVGVPAPARIAP